MCWWLQWRKQEKTFYSNSSGGKSTGDILGKFWKIISMLMNVIPLQWIEPFNQYKVNTFWKSFQVALTPVYVFNIVPKKCKRVLTYWSCWFLPTTYVVRGKEMFSYVMWGEVHEPPDLPPPRTGWPYPLPLSGQGDPNSTQKDHARRTSAKARQEG